MEPRPRIMKTNINKITQHLLDRITELGFDVYISCSNSNSRYLEIDLKNGAELVVRVSDHFPLKENREKFKFDIYTDEWRYGAIDYISFIDVFRFIVGEKKPLKKFT